MEIVILRSAHRCPPCPEFLPLSRSCFAWRTRSRPLPAKPHSTSTSRQFLVFGVDVALRGAICDLAEQTKSTSSVSSISTITGRRRSLSISIIPQANFPDAPAARLEVSQLGYGLKMQLNLLVTNEMSRPRCSGRLLRAILIEMMYRDRGNIAVGTPYVTRPDWLVEGVLALQPGRDSDENGSCSRALWVQTKSRRLRTLLGKRACRSTHRRANSSTPTREALLQLLARGTPRGRRSFGNSSADLPAAPSDAMADLCAHFPGDTGPFSRQMVGPERGALCGSIALRR